MHTHHSRTAALDIHALARDGLVLMDLLTGQDLIALREAHRALTPLIRDGFDSTLLNPDPAIRTVADQAVRQIVEPALSGLLPGLRIAFCSFATKSPECTSSAVPLHQDWSFVDEERFASFGLWCPLKDVDPDNGCLQIATGSHAWTHPPRAAFSPFRYAAMAEQIRGSMLSALPMRAGQAAMFDNRLIHCSPPNGSTEIRVAATAVLIPRPTRARYYHLIDRDNPDGIEVFDVDDDFYLRHPFPSRPDGQHSLGIIDIGGQAQGGS